MSQQPENKLPTTPQDEKPKALEGKLTKQNKLRAVYTLKCDFVDGNTFTYRSDDTLAEFTKKGYKYINELDALILMFGTRKSQIEICWLFDNRKPAGEDLLMHYVRMLGKIVINNLPKNYKL